MSFPAEESEGTGSKNPDTILTEAGKPPQRPALVSPHTVCSSLQRKPPRFDGQAVLFLVFDFRPFPSHQPCQGGRFLSLFSVFLPNHATTRLISVHGPVLDHPWKKQEPREDLQREGRKQSALLWLLEVTQPAPLPSHAPTSSMSTTPSPLCAMRKDRQHLRLRRF